MDSASAASEIDMTAAEGDDGLPTAGPAQAVPSRRAAVLRSAFVLGVLFVVFGLGTLKGPITKAVSNATGREPSRWVSSRTNYARPWRPYRGLQNS